MKRFAPPVRWFAGLLFAALVLWVLPAVYHERSADAFALYVMQVYVLMPLLSVLLPYFGGRCGLHPMAGFFPIGTAALFSLYGEHVGMALGMMAVSLVACVAGNEVKKRRDENRQDKE